MKADIQSTLDERGKRYGSFSGNAKISQELKSVCWSQPHWARLSNSQCEAVEMICHKLGRVLNGDPTYADSWRDIAGYAQLVVNELEGEG